MKFIAALILLFAVAVPGRTQNLMDNPSFEIQEEQNADLPERWTPLKRGSMENHHRLESDFVLEGKRAARISNANPILEKASLLWLQPNLGAKLKSVPPGTEMELSVYAIALNTKSRARLYLESPSARKTFQKTAELFPGRWQQVKLKFTLEDVEYGAAYVCLQLLGLGDVVFDQVYLGPAATAPPPLPAGALIPPGKNRIVNGDIEFVDEASGLPPGWTVLRKDSDGEALVDRTLAAGGASSLRLASPSPPGKMLAWSYQLDPGLLEDLAPETEMVLALNANTGSDPGVKFRLYIEFMQKSRFVGTSVSPPQTVYQGWERKELRFKFPAETPTRGYVVIQLLTAGTLNVDDVVLKRAADVPKIKSEAERQADDYCRVTNFPPRHTYFSPERPRELELEYFLPEPGLKVALSEIDDKTLAKWEFRDLPVRKTGTLKLPLPAELPENAYELSFTSGKLENSELFRIRARQNTGVEFLPNRMMKLDGQPFFPVGVLTPKLDPDAFRIYGDSGINTVCIGGFGDDRRVTRYMYDFASRHNLAVVNWNNFGDRAGISDGELRELMRNYAAKLEGIRNFIGFLADESAWRRIPIESLQRYYRHYFKYLPDYIAWQNHAPRMTGTPDEPRQSFDGVRRYSRAADVTGADIYPIPLTGGHNNLPNRTLSCVGDYTGLSLDTAWRGKPVWMVLQAFGWSESGGGKLSPSRPRPSFDELRFMAWDAVTSGATGIFWYGEGARDVYSEFWRDTANVSRELNAIGARIAGAGIIDFTDAGPVRILSCRKENEWTIAAVNRDDKEAAVFRLPQGARFFRSPEGLPEEKESLQLAPHEVVVLTSERLRIEPAGVFTGKEEPPEKRHGVSQSPALPDAAWVGHPQYLREEETMVCARHSFTVDQVPSKAVLRVAADDRAEIEINHVPLKESAFSHTRLYGYDIGRLLKPGENQVRFKLLNIKGPTGLLYELEFDGHKIASGSDTQFSRNGKDEWVAPHVFGKPPIAPWGAPRIYVEAQP